MADPDPKNPPAGDPPKADPPTSGPPPADPPKADPPKDPPKTDPPKDELLGDAGKRALEAERLARRDADKRAREAEAELDKIRTAALSEEEKTKKQAEEDRKAAREGRKALRSANLLLALQAKGIGNPKAAARLLDGVRYDDDTHEPSNLDEAITAAKAEFGEAMFSTGKRAPADINPGGGGGPDDGPKLTADEQQAARASRMTDDEYAWYRDHPTEGAYKPPEPVKT
jgi:hypothetical protein